MDTAQPEENEGTAAVFKNNKNVIVPFSVGAYVSEAFHSVACGKKPAKGLNRFGCNAIGKLVLRNLSGRHPTVGVGKKTIINAKFTPAFLRTLYDVVRFAGTKDHIPALLEPVFGRKGYFCSKAEQAIIRNYGFITTPLCGFAS